MLIITGAAPRQLMASVRVLTRECLRENIARQSQPNFYMDKLVLRVCWPQFQFSSLLPYLIRDGLVICIQAQ